MMARRLKKAVERSFIRVLAVLFAATVFVAGCSENGGPGTIAGSGGNGGKQAVFAKAHYLSPQDEGQQINVFSYFDGLPSKALISGRQELEKYHQMCVSGWDRAGNGETYNSECMALFNGYTDSYFEANMLLAIVVTAGSGSYRYEVTNVERGNGAFTVSIDEKGPVLVTDDMKSWLVLIELNGTYPANTAITVNIADKKDRLDGLSREGVRYLSPQGQGQYISGSTFYGNLPAKALITGRQELERYSGACVSGWAGRDEKILSAECMGILGGYTDSYFESRQLIAIVLMASSGSIRYVVTDAEYQNGAFAVSVNEDAPLIGTDDIKYWLILIEVDGTYPANTKIAVNVTEVVI